MTNRHRDTCVICGSRELTDFISYEMPVYMGASETSRDCLFEEMTYQHCKKCGGVQIAVEIDPTVLYQCNHNNGVIGKTWKNHYKRFYDFISDEVRDKNVLEISDPSAKVATLGSDYKKWTIVEPNPEFISSDKITVIQDYFGDHFNAPLKYDVVVHSHFMEHCFDVKSFLKKCREVLVDTGVMVFSIPNMEWLLDSGKIPNNMLQFEHTYYLDEDIVRCILQNEGFRVIDVVKYDNHSLFFKTAKTDVPDPQNLMVINKGTVIRDSIKKIHGESLNQIESFNEAVKSKKSNAYLFGCHVNSQYYIQNGLTGIDGILDNSSWKCGKYLYGTNYNTLNPKEIVGQDSPVVICSGCGPYKDELCDQLKSLNPTVVLL